jgi:glycogen operon protein
MLQAGDELGRTQHGNNNAYCQDNEISWIDWASADADLLAFVKALLALRRENVLLRADRYRHAEPDADGQSMVWLAPGGGTLSAEAWHDPARDSIACLLQRRRGHEPPDTALLILMNSGSVSVDFTLPYSGPWQRRVDTAEAPGCFEREPTAELHGPAVSIAAHSLQLLEYGGA